MKNVLLYLKKICNQNDCLIVATSGGPDSMCLLSLLCELKDELNLKIVVAHVNHNLRKESKIEASFVEQVSKKEHLIYEYMEITEYNKDNLENDARLKRYAFFDKLALKYHAKYLMTAHHGDDLTETILMRLVRGSSLKGYSGFKKEVAMSNYTIIRPLITETKKDIKDYMDEHHLKYYIDKSNFDEKLTRNRFRLNILPLLKKENQNVHQKFYQFSLELDDATNFINKVVKEKLKEISDEKGIKINKLFALDNFLVKKIIEYTLTSIYIDDLFLIDNRHTNLIINMLKQNKSNICIDLPGCYQAKKSYNYYKIEKNNKDKSYEYILKDKVILPNHKVIKIIKNSTKKSNNILRINSRDITLPLVIRTRKNGDKIKVKNLGGTKKIKDILIDEKVPVDIRDQLPIVTDSKNTILWLPGIKKSKFDVESNGIYDIILSYEEE